MPSFACAYYIGNQSFKASNDIHHRLSVLIHLYNKAVTPAGLTSNLTDEGGNRVLGAGTIIADHEAGVIYYPRSIPIDTLMREQKASESGLFNKLLLGPSNLWRANAVMAKIEKLDKALVVPGGAGVKRAR